jgi:hypothetical protein
VAPVRTDVSEERIASIFRVNIINELGTSAVTGNCSTLRIYHKLILIKSLRRAMLVNANVPSSLIIIP